MSDPTRPGTGRPLSPADRSILALETGAVVGHTVKIVELGGRVTAAEVAGRIRDRLPGAPSLATRLTGWPDAPRWTPDPGADVDTQVTAVAPMDGSDGWDEHRLRSQVAELFVRRLDRSRPLWHVAVAPLSGGRTALIWRLHHALADGMTAVRWAAHLFWDDPPPAPESASGTASWTDRPVPEAAGSPRPPRRTDTVGHWAGTAAATGASLVGFLAREVPVGGAPSPFDGPVSANRGVGWVRVPLATLKAAAHRIPGATVNDALLAAVAGGLRYWLTGHGRAATDLPVRVPVSLHPEPGSGCVDAGNADSFFTIALPVHLSDPAERLRIVAGQTSVRKHAQDARREDAMTRSLERFDATLGRFVDGWRTDPRRFALAVSNIPGPRQPVTVLGHPVTGLTTLAEIGERHGLRVAAISCHDALTIGFCADPVVVPEVQVLADATAAALREMLA
ncbi:DUF1298 domain-containing protein [Nakamurella flava]|uniref:diacylglycerol O-acyltransferase n=1 Tax=Nakamurella flava TaxID=2576308 RepID=A0A4U6QKT4_9ACTN|nr:WS/DGAT domain-containing protein [Nakamurella flava]TKV60899.1 DUF1298 domain-containing protein [Nakamurella flava]